MGYLTAANIDGTDYKLAGALYGTCTTAAGTAAKVVTCADFDSLETGVTIYVKFTNINTAANATMNVNGSGAKPLCQYGTTRVGTDGYGSWSAGAIIPFTYDGTSWVRSTTLATANDAVAQNGSLNSNSGYNVLLKNSPNSNNETGGVRFSTSDLTYNTGTRNLGCYKFNNYILSDACEKSVDTSIASGSTSTNLPTTFAVREYVDQVAGAAAAGALVYRGTVGTDGDITDLPAAHTKGWYYVVKTAGTFAGVSCEAGDMIICKNTGTTASDDDWDVIQANIVALTTAEIDADWAAA